jgi:outer membrane protein
MKPSIFNIVLAVAVVILYILHFTSKPQGPVFVNANDSTMLSMPGVGAVYVNGDSLLENYDYFKNAKKEFESKTLRTEKEIEAKRSVLELEFTNYQKMASSMSPEQRARTEESLMRKEQDLRLFSENAAAKLQEDQSKFNEQLFDKVSKYLKEHTKEKSYKIVFNFTKGSGILYANDSLDITQEVLEGLNKQYKEKSK